MKEIQTGDGSLTFFNKEYEDTYHSKSGAIEEAVEKFVKPTKIKDLAEKNGIVKILDIGFGLGYNVAAAIDVIGNNKIEIVSFEKNSNIFELIKKNNADFKSYRIIKKISKEFCGSDALFEDNNVKVELLFGDAVERIKEVDGKFNACFLDAFKPKTNPELWTSFFFKDIYIRMKSGAILATYSCAKSVRNNLIEAGFEVKDGPIVGRKSPSTIANKLWIISIFVFIYN